ncbi:hypothetical protein J6590_071232 [Homalodisca vitripennis]|nr:hypothetical protein J6590_071232 [Homalodisca vitripennis]
MDKHGWLYVTLHKSNQAYFVLVYGVKGVLTQPRPTTTPSRDLTRHERHRTANCITCNVKLCCLIEGLEASRYCLKGFPPKTSRENVVPPDMHTYKL